MLVAKLGAMCARGVAASVGLALGLGAGMPAAHAAGILDAPCTPGQKLIVKDYQGAAIASNGRGPAWRRSSAARTPQRSTPTI